MKKNFKRLFYVFTSILLLFFYACSESAIDNDVEETPSQPVETTPKINGYEYVDLGLSVLWATHNVGATNQWQYGGYYCWGELEQKNYYSQDTYEYYKYGSYVDIGTEISGTRYDVARMQWGNPWRLPTEAEVKELLDNCTCVVNIQGHGVGNSFYEEVVCAEFTGPNGNKIILPLSGYKLYNAVDDKKQEGTYLTGTKIDRAYIYTLDVSDNSSIGWMGFRYMGYSVRPVANKN